jgi:hypothetical protein
MVRCHDGPSPAPERRCPGHRNNRSRGHNQDRHAGGRSDVTSRAGASADRTAHPGFRLYDDLVIVESLLGEQQLSEPEDVSRYENYLELLQETASTGPDAVAIIRRALASISDQK